MSLTPIDGLLSWALGHGAYLHERVEIYNDPKFGISLKVQPSATAAKETAGAQSWKSGDCSLPLNSRIVSCPFSLSLSYLNALNIFLDLKARSTPFPKLFVETLEAHVVGHFFLMQQYLNVESSHWGPYIKSLPQPDEPDRLGTPLYFSPADMAWIRGTNLEVARDLRERTWRADWSRGALLLDSAPGWEMWKGKWTWRLYKWAATIFSSRSFISSLIPDEILSIPGVEGAGGSEGRSLASLPSNHTISSEHVSNPTSTVSRPSIVQDASDIRKEMFPVLFPLVDLANHSSDARVTWFTDVNINPKDLSIIAESEIPCGDQIFNNYALKSNAELLLGYGFCVPCNDEITIAFKPPGEESDVFSRNQSRGLRNNGVGKERHIFHVRRKPYDSPLNDMRLPEYKMFEDGCVDALAALASNQREKGFLAKYPNYSLEQSSEDIFTGPLSRNAFQVLSLLTEKLKIVLYQINSMGKDLGIPENSRQQAAKIYRDGQIATLQTAISPLQRRLDVATSQHTLCGHFTQIPSDVAEYAVMRDHTELLTLDCAFSWLHKVHPVLHGHIIHIIGTELEVAVKPELDFRELVEEGWDYTLWCLWIYTVLIVRSEIAENGGSGKHVYAWIEHMQNIYEPHSLSRHTFQGDTDEYQSLVDMITQLGTFLPLAKLDTTSAYQVDEEIVEETVEGDSTGEVEVPLGVEAKVETQRRKRNMINFASMLVTEECVVVGVSAGVSEQMEMESEGQGNGNIKDGNKERPSQRVLCVMKNMYERVC